MIKALLISLMLAFGTAQAGTFSIGPTPLCYGFCYNVPNSAGAVVNMSPPSKYIWLPETVYLSINGNAYIGIVPPYTTNYTDLVLTDKNENQITVSTEWKGTEKCSSGHAGGCSIVWELVSGTVVTP